MTPHDKGSSGDLKNPCSERGPCRAGGPKHTGAKTGPPGAHSAAGGQGGTARRSFQPWLVPSRGRHRDRGRSRGLRCQGSQRGFLQEVACELRREGQVGTARTMRAGGGGMP